MQFDASHTQHTQKMLRATTTTTKCYTPVYRCIHHGDTCVRPCMRRVDIYIYFFLLLRSMRTLLILQMHMCTRTVLIVLHVVQRAVCLMIATCTHQRHFFPIASPQNFNKIYSPSSYSFAFSLYRFEWRVAAVVVVVVVVVVAGAVSSTSSHMSADMSSLFVVWQTHNNPVL